MIVRSSFKCSTCGQVHTVRIGMGQETRQTHRFPCTKCGEDIVVALNVDFEKIVHWTEAVENAAQTAEEAGAPIMNVDANFVLPEGERHLDMAFPRLTQLLDMDDIAEKYGSLVSIDEVPERMLSQRPFRRPDFAEEWRLLKKAWSLHRRGQDQIAQKKIAVASDLIYGSDRLSDLRDWVWRFTLFIGQPHYEALFREAFEIIRPLMSESGFSEFAVFYNEAAEDRGERYFSLIKAFFEGYDDFSQVLFRVSKGMDVPVGNVASSIDFDATRMFYGDAFEVFASSVDILAYFNNLKSGRPFNQFEQLTQKQYLRLDKASRFEAFSAVPAFLAICDERDNQIRNASHHAGMRIERQTQTIRYRVGKGGSGAEQRLSYATYLARSSKLFLQAITLLRLEMMMCHFMGMRPPL